MTYKAIIIEDEPPAAKRLVKMISESPLDIEVIEILDSVEDSIAFFKSFKNYDLIFMDVQLGDGLSFDIFKAVTIEKPIIFTTAYDDYALQAFKVNSVDYLLKPIDQEDMNSALEQFKDWNQNHEPANHDMSYLLKALEKPNYKHRFLVKKGKQLIVIAVEDIAYFFSEDGYSFLAHKSGSKHIVDSTIDQLCSGLNPEMFHRINRKMLVSVDSLNGIHDYFNSRLKLELLPTPTFEVIVSRDRVKIFKNWLNNG